MFYPTFWKKMILTAFRDIQVWPGPLGPAPPPSGLAWLLEVRSYSSWLSPFAPLDRRARLPTSATPPAPSRPPGCSGPDSAPLEAGLASRRSVQPRRFRLHNANADGSLLANLLSLTAEIVRTGEQSVEPIAVNHVDAARGALARTHREGDDQNDCSNR